MSDDNKLIRTMYLRCMLASMMGIFGNSLGAIGSAMIVGQALGANELSIIGVTLPIYFVFATLGALLGIGGTALCGQQIGDGAYLESRKTFTLIYLSLIVIGLVISLLIFVFTTQITEFLGVARNMEIFAATCAYIRVLALGGIFLAAGHPAFHLLRLDGNTKAAALVFLLMSVTNIVTTYVLVVIFQTGVIGAAFALVISTAISGTLGAYLLFFKSENFRFVSPWAKAENENGATSGKLVSRIFVLGSPGALENLCILLRTIILNLILVSILHDILAVSAFKVLDSVNSFAIVFLAGVSGTLIPFVGVFSSEKDTSSIRQLLALSIKWGAIIIAVVTVICLIFAGQIAALFGLGDETSRAITQDAIRIFALSLPLAMLNQILFCLYQTNRNTAAANILIIGRAFLWIVIAAFMLMPFIGAKAVWHSFWIAETLAFIGAILYSVFYRLRFKLRYYSPLFLLDTEAEVKGIYKSFSVENSNESITKNAEMITSFCEANDLSARHTMAIGLAIEEMLVIIKNYCLNGEKDHDATMNVRLLLYDNKVTMRIRNGGKAFNPLAFYEQQSTEEEKLESLGIGMIIKLAQSIDYQNTFGVNNIAIII